MSDVEKYGLFAVVFVGGLLLVVAFQGGLGGSAPPILADGPAPLVLEQPVALAQGPRAGSSGAARPVEVQVRPLMSDQPFRYDEAPVNYHGPRSATPSLRTGSAVATQPASAVAGTHVVVEGDTLGRIAALHLGSEARWQELLALNPGVDPKRMKLGQVLRLRAEAPGAAPSASAPAAAPAATKPATKPAAPAASGPRTHVVKPGDTLSGLALSYLGSVTRADDIFAANSAILKSPDDLKPGQTLRIP